MSQSTENYQQLKTKSDKVLTNQGFVMITRARSQDHVLRINSLTKIIKQKDRFFGTFLAFCKCT